MTDPGPPAPHRAQARGGTRQGAEEWERRLAALWARLDDRAEDQFVAAIDALTGELRAGPRPDR